jgi:hypothetical protein
MPQNIVEQLSREQQIAALEKDWATNPTLERDQARLFCGRCRSFARFIPHRTHIGSPWF